MVGGSLHSTPLCRRRRCEIVREPRLDGFGKALSLPSDIVLRVIDQPRELRGAIFDSRGKRNDGAPALRSERLLPKALVKLSEADERQQVALIKRKTLLQRRPLRLLIPKLAVRAGEVQPERRRLWVATAGDREMFGRRARVASLQRIQAERVPGGRLLTVDCEDGFEVLPGNVRPAGPPGAMRLCKELLDAAGHEAN
jgi:hypothetical protein